ncbi:glucosidase II beta subunit-like-domain-containing protein [Suillus clintonianus]|uniref:glucosidase II beta subunit-like-domain-containing protein n=1 Tax=Suillus clintonianus TaxID=1904413 RepID=UPI001B87A5E3|nr:glucosidase II beta subunit-like-domain-containing protein [Suillus clintonianus]KAG2147979.1 glucosidase II beta subunit-like-domain-containing protein [Suillus clintonianus]
MHPWLFLALALPSLAALDKTHGVPPSLVSKYVPSTKGAHQKWTCLDGSKEIAWSAVNDDYCDCPDGSDEPGTSACPNNKFYCRNEGHIGAIIQSSHVNDGLCEQECCDGSDEPSGVCPNTCQEVGAEHRKKTDAERKLRKTGSKIRSSYIGYAHKEKKRLEALMADLVKEIETREKEVERLRGVLVQDWGALVVTQHVSDIAERAESLSAAELERKKQSPLYQSLLVHHTALKSLQKEHKKHLEREGALGDILTSLRAGYNPNYQDMAVLEAVRGWETLAELPHINDVRKGDDGEADVTAEKLKTEDAIEEEGLWNAAKIEKELDQLLKADHVTLLLEHDQLVGPASAQSLLLDISAYLPDALLPSYHSFRDSVLSALSIFGIGHGGTLDTSAESNRARVALSDAEHSLKLVRDEQQDTKEGLLDLFDPQGFGPEGEWKKLDGTCLSKDTGEYTYEVCLFDEARQIPNSGGSGFSLGKYSSWNKAAQPGELEYYTKQHYTQGAKCWNGPHRSVELVLTCGIENALLTVAELEKCEYQITGTTPALCRPLEDEPAKDEL